MGPGHAATFVQRCDVDPARDRAGMDIGVHSRTGSRTANLKGRTVRRSHAGQTMFERFTEDARRVLFFGRYEASQLGDLEIKVEHLLLGLARTTAGVAARIFADRGISLDDIRRDI